MQIGIFVIGDIKPDPHTGVAASEHQRIHDIVRIGQHAEAAGFDVFALGEHHNPPFVPSSPTTVLGYLAARTGRITLSTSTTLITTNDPVKLAEDYAMLQHLADGRVDVMLGRGNSPDVYSWFGRDGRDGLALAAENYRLLRRLWREEAVDWTGEFRTPLRRFTAVPRPLDGRPPFVWHGANRSPETAEQAACHGDGFFVNNLFLPITHFGQLVDRYRAAYEAHGHGPAARGIVGAGGQVFVRPRSQDAVCEFRPYFGNTPSGKQGSLEDFAAGTGLIVGSPQQVIDKVLSFRTHFGDYQRQLFMVDHGGVPLGVVLDVLGREVGVGVSA